MKDTSPSQINWTLLVVTAGTKIDGDTFGFRFYSHRKREREWHYILCRRVHITVTYSHFCFCYGVKIVATKTHVLIRVGMSNAKS